MCLPTLEVYSSFLIHSWKKKTIQYTIYIPSFQFIGTSLLFTLHPNKKFFFDFILKLWFSFSTKICQLLSTFSTTAQTKPIIFLYILHLCVVVVSILVVVVLYHAWRNSYLKLITQASSGRSSNSQINKTCTKRTERTHNLNGMALKSVGKSETTPFVPIQSNNNDVVVVWLNVWRDATVDLYVCD